MAAARRSIACSRALTSRVVMRPPSRVRMRRSATVERPSCPPDSGRSRRPARHRCSKRSPHILMTTNSPRGPPKPRTNQVPIAPPCIGCGWAVAEQGDRSRRRGGRPGMRTRGELPGEGGRRGGRVGRRVRAGGEARRGRVRRRRGWSVGVGVSPSGAEPGAAAIRPAPQLRVAAPGRGPAARLGRKTGGALAGGPSLHLRASDRRVRRPRADRCRARGSRRAPAMCVWSASEPYCHR